MKKRMGGERKEKEKCSHRFLGIVLMGSALPFDQMEIVIIRRERIKRYRPWNVR